MRPEVFCLGAINLDLTFRVDDLAGLLKRWGTGLARGGEEALSRAEEHRLRELLARFARPAGRFGGGQAANTATPWPAWEFRWPWRGAWEPMRTALFER